MPKVKLEQNDLILSANKVQAILSPKKIKSFSKSGAYISVTGDFADYSAYVVVLRKGVDK